MSTKHKDCRSARGGFSRCWGFQIVRAVCPTRRLHAPVGETLAAPESEATWAKRARDAGKRAVPVSFRTAFHGSSRPVLAARHGTQIPVVQKSSPARSQTAFKSTRDYVFTM